MIRFVLGFCFLIATLTAELAAVSILKSFNSPAFTPADMPMALGELALCALVIGAGFKFIFKN